MPSSCALRTIRRVRMNLREFVHNSGGPRQAAALIGVCVRELYRWDDGENRPRSAAILWKLKELGIELGEG